MPPCEVLNGTHDLANILTPNSFSNAADFFRGPADEVRSRAPPSLIQCAARGAERIRNVVDIARHTIATLDCNALGLVFRGSVNFLAACTKSVL